MEQIEPKIECDPLVPQIKNEIVEDEPIMPNITENGPEIYIKLEGDCDEYENSPSEDSTSPNKRKRGLNEVDSDSDIDHNYCPRIPKLLKNNSEIYRCGNNYECPDCPFISSSQENFAKHVKNHRTIAEKCDHCSFRSTKSAVTSHELIHEERILKCTYCPLTNRRRKTCIEHLQLEHNIPVYKNNQSIRVNPIARKDTMVKNGVIKNVSTITLPDNVVAPILETGITQIKSATTENCVIGPKIPRKFNKSVNRIPPEKDRNRFVIDTNGNRWLKCLAEDCPYKTTMLSSLKGHRIFHKHKGSLKCQYCSFRCKGQGELTWHLLQHVEQQNEIGNVKPDRTFCKEDKVEHDRTQHKRDISSKRHKKSVLQGKYLKQFLKYHKKSRQHYYQCPDCPFKNKKRTIFAKHFVKHKKTAEEKCFYCTFRGTALEVKEHKLIHKKKHILKCDSCNIKFRKRLGLEHHMVLKHAISRPRISHCNPTNDVIEENNEHNTQDDIIAVILKEQSSVNCSDSYLEAGRSLLTTARRQSINQSNEHCNEESDQIKAVLLKKDSCNFYNDNNEILNESLEHSIESSKEPCDDDTQITNVNNQTITITITTSSNVNGSDLIKQALVDEILKTFQVSKVQELSSESQHNSNDETIVVTDIHKSFDIAKEREGSIGLTNTYLDQANTQENFETYIEDMVVEIAADHENGDRGGESNNIPNHINEENISNMVVEIAANHVNGDREGKSDNIPNHISEQNKTDILEEIPADHENGEREGESDNIPNHINQENKSDMVVEIPADHENVDREDESNNIHNHINEENNQDTNRDGVIIKQAFDILNSLDQGKELGASNENFNPDTLISLTSLQQCHSFNEECDRNLNEKSVEENTDNSENQSALNNQNVHNSLDEDSNYPCHSNDKNCDRSLNEESSDNGKHISSSDNPNASDSVLSKSRGIKCVDVDCPYIANHLYDLKSHLRDHRQNGTFKCGHCTFSSSIRIIMKIHMQEHFKASKSIHKEDSELNVKDSDKDLNGNPVEDSTGNNANKSASEKLNTSTLVLPESSNDIKCIDVNCPFKTNHMWSLNNHLSYHRREGHFKCKHCTFSSTLRPTLVKHEREHLDMPNVLYRKDDSNNDLNGKILEDSTGNWDSTSAIDLNALNSLRKESKEPCDSNDRDLHGNALEDKNDNNTSYSVTSKSGVVLKCPDAKCPYKTNLKLNLNNHLERHQLEGPLKCQYCTFSATSRISITKHMQLHIDDSDSVMPKSSKDFKCLDVDCPYKTNNMGILKKHMTFHRQEGALKCQHCTFSATYPASLMKHVKTHIHTLNSLRKESKEPGDSHDKDLHGNTLEDKNDNNTSYSVTSKSGVVLKCPDAKCPYKTHLKLNLNNHLKLHHLEGPLKCQYCTFSAISRIDITKHMQLHIDTLYSLRKESKEPCDSNDRDLHGNTLEDNNDNNTPYSVTSKSRVVLKCPDAKCPYKTHRKLYLNNHLKLHQQEGPLKCQYCTFGATSRICIAKHMQLHMEFSNNLNTKKQKSEQPESTKSFVARTESGGHKSNTTSVPESPYESWMFQCTYCPTKFPEERFLKGHLQLHSSTRGIKCPICTYRHNKTGILKHLSWHGVNDEDPFRCPICDLKKRTKENMDDHLKVVHSEAIYQKHDSVCKSKTCNGFCQKTVGR